MQGRLDLSTAQVKAFESPIRASLINALRAHSALTVREMSEILGLTPDRLYYHVRHLLAAGLMQSKELRPAETRPEVVYELTAKEFYMDNLALDLEYATSVYRSAKNIHRLALSRYENALTSGTWQEIRFGFAAGRMSKVNIEKLKEDLREIGRRVLASNDPDGQPVLFTTLVVPTDSLEE